MAKKSSVKKSSVLSKKETKTPKIEHPRYYGRLIRLMVALAVLVMLVSVSAWARHVYNDPDSVFWGAVENNLRGLGATRHIVQEDGNLASNQFVQFVTIPPHLAHGTTSIKQDSNPPITVDTESIGTPYKDLVRYTHAQTSQQTTGGGTENFNSILNIWGVSGSEVGSNVTGGQLYADSILNIIPSANLNYSQRKEVMEQMRKVYTVDQDKMVKRVKDGRPQYIYEVTVDFEEYIRALKLVAKYVGLSQLDNIDPASFADRQAVPIEVVVDVWSRGVTQFGVSTASRVELFVGRGIKNDVEIPTQTIPLEELQERINVIDQEQ